MERDNPHRLLILTFFVLTAATSAETISQVVHVSDAKTWWDAQNYCRSQHSDLVTIRDKLEANKLASFEGWIGLYLGLNFTWKWSRGDELAIFTFWDIGEPIRDRGCGLKHSSLPTWMSANCKETHPFLCVDERVILIEEKKTWEEALFHCRGLQGGDPATAGTSGVYNFASLPEAKKVLLDSTTMQEEATDEVWVGLRFLAGKWLWVNGEAVTSSYLPPCPDQQQYCGALNYQDDHWTVLNCNEKRQFLCSFNQ